MFLLYSWVSGRYFCPDSLGLTVTLTVSSPGTMILQHCLSLPACRGWGLCYSGPDHEFGGKPLPWQRGPAQGRTAHNEMSKVGLNLLFSRPTLYQTQGDRGPHILTFWSLCSFAQNLMEKTDAICWVSSKVPTLCCFGTVTVLRAHHCEPGSL